MINHQLFLFDFLFVLRFYSPVNPMGSCRAWSGYLTTLLLGRLSPLGSILSPETDNSPSWISRGERMTLENISWSNLHKRMLQTCQGLHLQSPDHQLDAHPTKPPKPAFFVWKKKKKKKKKSTLSRALYQHVTYSKVYLFSPLSQFFQCCLHCIVIFLCIGFYSFNAFFHSSHRICCHII